MTYPKIETVYERGDDFRVDSTRVKRPEFRMLFPWHLTEKIDGTNIRIVIEPEREFVYAEACTHIRDFGGMEHPSDPVFAQGPAKKYGILGRTDRAQTPSTLVIAINELLPPIEVAWDVFHADDNSEDPYVVTLYGEGYGPRIQKGGGSYRDTPGFRLFDVKVGRKWLDWPNVESVAEQLGLQTAPVIDDDADISQAYGLVRGFDSIVARQDGGTGLRAEGVVARTVPYVYDWRGDRIMWKLKTKDLP